MTRASIAGALALAGLLAFPLAGQAAFIAYNDTGASAGGAGGDLNIGHEFTVTGAGITVTDLGVYDNGNNGLAASHDVTLFSIGSTGQSPPNAPLATVNVPAGTSAALQGGFRFEPIAPTFLPAGNYAVIAYTTNTATDPYGDGGGLPDGITTPNVTDFRFDPYQFNGGGTPNFPNAGDSNIHSSASFLYTIPEPSSLVLLGLGLIGLAYHVARRR